MSRRGHAVPWSNGNGENREKSFSAAPLRTKNVSEATMQSDIEIHRIIDGQYGLARKLIEENRDKIEVMAKALLEWETIDSDQIGDIMEGRAPRPPKPTKSAPPPPKDNTPPAAPATTVTPAQEV